MHKRPKHHNLVHRTPALRLGFLFIVFIFCVVHGGFTQSLSADAKIAVLTCDPGDEIHTVFGHSAIWVSDPRNQINEVYNYGTFSYNADNFLLNFLKGKMHYALGKSTLDRFVAEYRYYKRGVRVQELNLDSVQKNRYYNFLKTNYLPENRMYWYDYFFDNCATRIGVSLEEEVDGFMYSDTVMVQKSHRDLLDEYMGRLPWTDFGIDLIQGQLIDRKVSFREAMFLPDYLETHLAKASLSDNQNLVQKSYPLISFKKNQTSFNPFTPLILFCVLALFEFMLFLFGGRWKKGLLWYDLIWFVVIGFISLIMLFMWFGTGHIACSQNWNLVWASPLYIGLLMFWKKKNIRKNIVFVLLGLTLLAGFGYWIFPQQYHVAIIPICITLTLKLLRNISIRVIKPWMRCTHHSKKQWMTS